MNEIKREPNLPAPTDCFGNEQPMATWYECPKCGKQSPLTREWVGLTDEDIYKVIEENIPPQLNTLFDMAKWVGGVIEAKLKEKNA